MNGRARPHSARRRSRAPWTIARFAGMGVGAMLALASGRASAEVSEAAGRPDEQFDVMNLLTQHGLHDIQHETWNAYGQFTFIGSYKLPFPARYTDKNGSHTSLSTDGETSWTGTLTLFLGTRLWTGAEAYFVPEVIAERALSRLHGLGGAIQNFELQKNGVTTPQVYRSRLYLQQTIGLGGGQVDKTSDPMQLGSTVDRRRLVLRAGTFSIIDFLDKNTYAGDLRQQFFNMAFLTYAAYDFGADARGYSFGALAELDYDDWSLRVGRMAAPLQPNGLALSFRLDKQYGDQAELEHQHRLAGRAGAVRVLAFRNRERMGRFDDAVAQFRADPTKNATTCPPDSPQLYDTTNASAPDLCWARNRPNVKVGIGINLEQAVTDDVGVFFRGMYADGRTEVYSYTSTDRSISLGALAQGRPWHRPRDVAGIGLGVGWISGAHARYLALGGVDGFIGDGAITAAPESVFEVFYSVNILSTLWLSGDYQHITNPAFNSARGPVDVFGARLHAEF